MMDIFEKNFYSKQYILVDTYKYKGNTLFHFGAVSLDDEIFCKKVNEEYIPITDEFEISIIKNKFGLINLPYYYDTKDYLEKIKKVVSQFNVKPMQNKIYKLIDREPLSIDDGNNIRKEQINFFKEIKEKYKIDIDLEDIIDKINKVRIFKADKLHNGVRGYYRPATNSIVLQKNIVDEETTDNKHVRLHEFIHAMGLKPIHTIEMKKDLKTLSMKLKKDLNIMSLLFTSGLVEGQTENLAQSFFDNNISKKLTYYHKGKENKIQYNFSKDTTYHNLVTLVQQMEYVMGKKSYESIIKGNMSFENEFANEYGLKLMAFMTFRTRRLHIEEYNSFAQKLNNILGRHFDVAKYLNETQNILMEKVFEKDFGKVENLEDSKKFLEKLRNFETVRAKITTINHDKKEEVEDTSFEEYYQKKFGDISKLLEEKGISRDIIDVELEQYQYEKQEYKPLFTKEEELGYAKNSIICTLADVIIANNDILDISDYEVKAFRLSNEMDYYFFILEKGTKEGFLIESISSERAIRLYGNIFEGLNASFKDKIELLRDKGFEEINIEMNPEETKNGIIYYLEKEIEKNKKWINKYKDKDTELVYYLQEKNESLIKLLDQYGKEYKPTTEIESNEEIDEKLKEGSLPNKVEGVKFPKLSMKELVKDALGRFKIRTEDVKKADKVELREKEKENENENEKGEVDR